MRRRVVQALVAFALVAISARAQSVESAQTAARAVTPEPALYVFLGTPTDLNGLIARFASPDFVLLDWDRYQALLNRSTTRPEAASVSLALRSIEIGGRLDDDRADLDLRFRFHVEGGRAVEAPLKLDGLVLSEISEGERALPVTASPGDGWTVELRGPGDHEVRVRLSVPVRAAGERRRIELPLPESPVVRIELTAAPDLAAPVLGSGEALTIHPRDDGTAIVAGLVPPRPRLALEWTVRRPEADPGRPVFSVQGETTVAVEHGVAQIASNATIRIERGAPAELGIDVDITLEDVDIFIDTQKVDPEVVRRDPQVSGRIWIPLAASPQRTIELVIRARRSLPRGDSASWTFRGFPVVDAPLQSGLLAISAVDDLVVNGRTARGLRSIDPRTELSPTLRARPSIVLGYRVLEQPYQLELQVDRSQAWLSAQTRSTIWSDEQALRVDSWIDYRGTRGRFPRLEIDIPDTLRLTDIGPDATIAGIDIVQPHDAPPEMRRLVIRLSDQVSTSAQVAIHLSGVQDLNDGANQRLSPPRPRNVDSWSGIVAVVDARDVTLQPAPSAGPALPIRSVPASWMWPQDRPDLRAPRMTWFRHDGANPSLSLRVEHVPLEVSARSSLDARFDRRGIDLRQELDLLLEHGRLDALELDVPAAIRDDWQVLGVDVLRRRDLSTAVDGPRRVRLELARPIDVRSSIRLRGRVEFQSPIHPGDTSEVELPEFTLMDVPLASREVAISAETGTLIEPKGEGWLARSGTTTDESSQDRARWTRVDRIEPPPIRVRLSGPRRVDLPPLYVARLVAVSTWTAENSVSVDCALTLLRNDGSLELSLPRGAEWMGARLGTSNLEEIESLDGQGNYRLRIPPSDGTTRIELRYIIPHPSESEGWWGPRLSARAAVETAFWEIRLPSSHTLIGLPSGWDDENEWYWDRYVWRRRPRGEREVESLARATADDTQRYLFSRVGSPRSGTPSIAPRPLLLGVSSSLALIWTSLILLGGRHRSLLLAGSAIAAAALATVLPGVLLGQIVQSGLAGVGLGVLAAAIRQRRHQPAPREITPSAPSTDTLPTPVAPPSSHPGAAVAVGSDDSTIVRRRASSRVAPTPEPRPESSEPTPVEG